MRGMLLVSAAVLPALTTGCGDGIGALPPRDAEVSGMVQRDELGVRLVEPTDTYYEGMSLLDDDTLVVRASDGAVVDETALQDGVAVDVWVDEACAESYPVQCGIEAIRVLDAAGT